MDTQAEINKLWDWAAMTSARLSAIDAVIGALAAQQQANPAYLAALTASMNNMEALQLNNAKLSDKFIADFQNHLLALTPPQLRDKLR